MPAEDPHQPRQRAELLAALAAPGRPRIVPFLADGPHNVGEIAAMFGVPAVNVSRHLIVLKGSGLIGGTRKGRFVCYALRPGVLEDTIKPGVPRDAPDLGYCRLELPLDGCSDAP